MTMVHGEQEAGMADNELMMQVRAGEIEKLGVLFQKYHRPLLHFFLRFTRNYSVSEDLAQDVFVRILKYRHTFGEGSQFAAWMYQIARNIQFKHFRKHEREVALDEDDFRENIADEEPAPDKQMERDQDIDFLKTALASLPKHKREVLLLSRFHDLKYREIAERLSCDVGTVKVRAFRALKDVEQAFLQLAGDPIRIR